MMNKLISSKWSNFKDRSVHDPQKRVLFTILVLTKFLFLTTLFFIWPLTPAVANEPSNKICFFEMDNTTTGENFKSRFENGDQSANIYVHEVKDNENAKQAFENMISQSGGCQGLVISGHHTGDWFSEKGDNILWLKELERLACDPAHKNWFSQIQGLWLDGSHTVTDDNIIGEKINPDSKTLRQLEKDIFDRENSLHGRMTNLYQQSYAGSLSEHTPLSSRYLRMFPKTQIFGFTGFAPKGAKPQQVGERSFVAEQILMTVDNLTAEAAKNENKKMTENTLNTFFSNIDTNNCGGSWNEVSNQETASIANKDHKEASRLGCELILAKQQLEDDNPSNDAEAKQQLLEALKEINDSNTDGLTDLLFNNIYDSLQTAERLEDENFLNEVKEALKGNKFKQSLEKRITSSYTASLRKGDYIYLYKKLHGEITEDMQTAINTLIGKATKLFGDAHELKTRDQPEPSEEVKRALAASVVDQLTQYDLLTDAQIIGLRSEVTGLFTENALNNYPFIADVYTRLHLTVKDEGEPSRPNTEAIINGFQNNNGESLRPSRIRVGAQILFSSKEGNPDISNLRKMAKKLNYTGRNAPDRRSFFQALHQELRGKTSDQKVEFLTEISKGQKASLPLLVFAYSRKNLSNDEKPKFCKAINNSSAHRRYRSTLQCDG